MKRTKSTARTREPRAAKSHSAPYLGSWTAVADFLCANFPACEKSEGPANRDVVRVAGKVLSYRAANDRSKPAGVAANEEFVIVRIDFERREQLLESDPASFFVTPHYQNYPGVIVRISTVNQKQFRDLLRDGWRLVAPKRLVRDCESNDNA
jgi:hypothetical protein